MQVVVIGAGIVGLACAEELARRRHDVIVLERHARIAEETSSRNSGVIHAGLYYPPGSLKARLCVEGRTLLYERCARLGIGHRKTGKLVVATSRDEVTRLEALYALGRENGAGALELIDGAEVRRREPRVHAVAALYSPETGIVDAHELAQSYRAEAEQHGAVVVLNTEVMALERRGGATQIATQSHDGEHFTLEADVVVNAAGLASDRIAAMSGIDIDACAWRIFPCKGDYFAISGRLARPTERLVYPLPHAGGLGVHVTMDLGGRYRLGPDTEYVSAPRYDIDAGKAQAFAEAVQRYLPAVQASDLSPDFAGVRPKLGGNDVAFRDFVIDHDEESGIVHLVGIDSPGLTAAAAIAAHVAARLAGAC